jgi:hypothetical protein
MDLGFFVGLFVLYWWAVLTEKTLDLFFRPPHQENNDNNKTLASNGDDSFINGIMWADVGNDL